MIETSGGTFGKSAFAGLGAAVMMTAITAATTPATAFGAQARARPMPQGSPAGTGVVAPRPAAPEGHEPRVRPGRSRTGARTARGSTAAPANVAHSPNVGRPKLRHLPGPFLRLRHGGKILYYCLGRFYTRHGAGYTEAETPVGAVVRSLPAGHETIEVGGRTLHYHDGVFYEAGDRPREYVVVPAPVGAVVGHLPHDAEEVVVRGTLYHVAGGVHYLPVRRQGELVYVVSEP